MAADDEATTDILKQALVAKAGGHVGIAVEADDGTNFKIVASAQQLEALTGGLEGILDEDDAEAAE